MDGLKSQKAESVRRNFQPRCQVFHHYSKKCHISPRERLIRVKKQGDDFRESFPVRFLTLHSGVIAGLFPLRPLCINRGVRWVKGGGTEKKNIEMILGRTDWERASRREHRPRERGTSAKKTEESKATWVGARIEGYTPRERRRSTVVQWDRGIAGRKKEDDWEEIKSSLQFYIRE